MFAVELSTFVKDRLNDLRQRWHFVNRGQVRETYSDIYDRLLRYGIRLLENPKITWEHWVGTRPLAQEDI